MAGIITSVSLRKDVYETWKRSGLKLNHVIQLGLMTHNKTPGYLERIRELEAGNDKLQRKLTILMNTVNKLEMEAQHAK